MSRSSTIISGFFGAFALSCGVMVLAPQAQLGGLQPTATEEEPGKFTDIYPVENVAVESGRVIYAREGCIACHSQQIRDPQNGADSERGWGPRRTVARDYLYESPPFLGSSRLGPDLANVGAPEWRDELPGDTRRPVKRDEAWFLTHLYQPRVIIDESICPSYRYLFTTRDIAGERAVDALNLTGDDAPPAGKEIVPSPEAKVLARYLLSLNRTHAVPEVAAEKPAAPPAK